jgi:enolase-phosphatase E1
MKTPPISTVLMDIEGTTSSVDFVYNVLFPYFRQNINQLFELEQNADVRIALDQTKLFAHEKEGVHLSETSELIEKLTTWSLQDQKITPLKTIQGIIWKNGYESGQLKGHVYPDVPNALKAWKNQGLTLAVFSSGSVDAQKLIFGHSIAGDLTSYFSHYFDTQTGHKRDEGTYVNISNFLQKSPEEVLFLSDIPEELSAADNCGMKTVQLVRPGTKGTWKRQATSFDEIDFEQLNK